MKFSSQNIENQFLEFCAKNRLISQNDTIIAGISGGVDSLVMLSLLVKFRHHFDIKIVALHFNHMLRGEKADNDQKLVEEYCKKTDVEFYSQKMDVMQFAKEKKLSFEMAGRDLRYAFFDKIAEKYSNSKIATAHILNDNTETILMRIFKGTGLRGMQGIDVKRGNIIRPILFAHKDELYQYAKANDIPYSDDHTNFENDCLRNVIRNEILPLIKNEINPNIDKSLSNFSVTVGETIDHLNGRILNIFDNILVRQSSYEVVLKIDELSKLDITERKEVILQAFQRLDEKINSYPGFVEMEQVENLTLMSETGKYVQPFQHILVERNRDLLHVVNLEKLQWTDLEILSDKIYPKEFFIFSSKFIKFEEFSGANNLSSVEHIDVKKIVGKLKLRHWQKGDTFQPFGSNFRKKLSDFFIDAKLPRYKKHHLPILVDDEKIIWICGYRLSNEVKISKNTTQILEIKYEENR